MDGSALFASLLDPGERLLWTGEPRKLIFAVAGGNFAILTVGLGYLFGKLLRLQRTPLPLVLELELVLVGFMLVGVGYMLGTRILRAWKTAYALTDRRLLTVVGWKRNQMRSVPLADLDAVKTEYRPKMGKVLLLRPRGASKPWVWAVGDVNGVRHLIESARSAASSQAA